MSLVDFVLARIAEDEEHGRLGDGTDFVPAGYWDNARVLAEVEAKRRLVDWSAPVSGSERVPTDRPGVYDVRPVRHVNEDGEDVLRYLAMPYADHPDYLEEWRP